MRYTELQSKSQAELNEMLKELQVKLGKLRFELANKSLKDTSQLSKARKDIARVMTAIRDTNIRMHTNNTNKPISIISM